MLPQAAYASRLYFYADFYTLYREVHRMISHLLIKQLLQILRLDRSPGGNSLCGVRTIVCSVA